jgi:hypothetical protein
LPHQSLRSLNTLLLSLSLLVGCIGSVTPTPQGEADGGSQTPPISPDESDGGAEIPDGGNLGPTDFDAGVGCADTWENYGQEVFQTTCASCHLHDQTDYKDVAKVRATASAIAQRVTSDEMPVGLKLSASAKNRLLD